MPSYYANKVNSHGLVSPVPVPSHVSSEIFRLRQLSCSSYSVFTRLKYSGTAIDSRTASGPVIEAGRDADLQAGAFKCGPGPVELILAHLQAAACTIAP
jgi:hypothetical protein